MSRSASRTREPAARTRPAAGLEQRRRRVGQRGATSIEFLVLVALIALGLIGAVKALQAKYAALAEREGDAIASLSALSSSQSPGVGQGAPPSPPAERPAPPPPKKEEDDDGGWGLPDWVKDVGNFVVDMSPIGDVKTLFDPNASLFDKVLAGTSLVTSVIPGVGQAVKGVTVAVKVAKTADRVAGAADKAKDGAKAADKAKDGTKAGDKADETGDLAGAGKKRKTEDEAEEAPSNADDPDCQGEACKNGKCFAAGTPVHTEYGVRPIELVEPGDALWSRDEDTGEVALQRVLHKFVTPDKPILRLDLDDGSGAIESLRVTAPHPFWTQRGWVAAKDLTLEDDVMLRSGAWATVAGGESLDERVTVYNFEVEEFHTYFVSEAGFWVHNDYEDERTKGDADDPDDPEARRRAEEDEAWDQRKTEEEDEAWDQRKAEQEDPGSEPEQAEQLPRDAPRETYDSIRDAPEYPDGFQDAQQTTKNTVKNKELLDKLREVEGGDWKKVYKDGYDAQGNPISVHYFESKSGKVFNVKVKPGWSN